MSTSAIQPKRPHADTTTELRSSSPPKAGTPGAVEVGRPAGSRPPGILDDSRDDSHRRHGPSMARMQPAPPSGVGSLLSRALHAGIHPVATVEPAPVKVAGSPQDRRAFPRRDSGCLVSVHRLGNFRSGNVVQQQWHLHSSRLKGELVDISMNGAAFLLSQNCDADEHILLRLSNPHFDKQVDASAQVVRSIPSGDGSWKVVCQFDKRLTFEQVHDLGKHLFQSVVV